MLSAYGGSGSDGTDTNGDATVDVADLLSVLSSFGQECGSSSSSSPPDCAMGDDCGGQEWTDCGSSCPSICGEAPAGFCIEMCNSGFFCPSALMWDGGAGACVAESDCSEAGGAWLRLALLRRVEGARSGWAHAAKGVLLRLRKVMAHRPT